MVARRRTDADRSRSSLHRAQQFAEHAGIAMGGKYGDTVSWSANTSSLAGYMHGRKSAVPGERGDG